MLKFYRERRGWTQDDLASVSGYGDRVLSKAENGGSILATTIDDLAESLSIPEEPLYPEDLISDPLELAKEFHAALNIHQINIVEKVKHFVDDRFVFKMAGDPSVIPFAGEFHGLEGLQQFVDIFFSILEVPKDYDHEPYHQYIVEGNKVVAKVESWVHPIGQPMDKPMKGICHLLFERGKLILFDNMYDTDQGVKVVVGNDDDG